MPAAPAASPTIRIDAAACARTIAGSSRCRLAREQRERLGLQAVAGEDRDAVAVDDVQRRPAAPQRVVVHRRQVVVDERVGVDELERARGGQRAAPRLGGAGAVRRADGVGRGERQDRAQALAAGEARCSASPRATIGGTGRRRRQTALERRVDPRARAGRGTRRASRRVTASAALGIVGGERRRRRLQLAALVEDLDAALGLFEPRVAEARELDAALVERERLLERQVAFLELLDDRFELGDRGFEVFDRWCPSSMVAV